MQPNNQGKAHEIHIHVDGEPVTAPRPSMTPNEIIREIGLKDPATNYLSQIKGQDKTSYKDVPDTPIELHNGMKFQIISTGPTPVSDRGHKTGLAAFVEGLERLGFAPTVLAGHADHVVIDYIVQTGKFAGKAVKHGFIVPGDFPLSVPGGPHVSPRIHSHQPTGVHPLGGCHNGSSQGFEDETKAEWQYWSRPFQGWTQSPKTVTAYMSHIWQLWDSL